MITFGWRRIPELCSVCTCVYMFIKTKRCVGLVTTHFLADVFVFCVLDRRLSSGFMIAFCCVGASSRAYTTAEGK
jgi:hypothetical protein